MAVMTRVVRCVLWMLILVSTGCAISRWWRARKAPTPPETPEWPPIPIAESDTATAPSAGVPLNDIHIATPKAPNITDDQLVSTPSDVNAIVDATEVGSSPSASSTWAAPLEDGSCPIDYPIKANDNSGIFHAPGTRFYDRTKPERCYTDADAAIADGYRQTKS